MKKAVIEMLILKLLSESDMYGRQKSWFHTPPLLLYRTFQMLISRAYSRQLLFISITRIVDILYSIAGSGRIADHAKIYVIVKPCLLQ